MMVLSDRGQIWALAVNSKVDCNKIRLRRRFYATREGWKELTPPIRKNRLFKFENREELSARSPVEESKVAPVVAWYLWKASVAISRRVVPWYRVQMYGGVERLKHTSINDSSGGR